MNIKNDAVDVSSPENTSGGLVSLAESIDSWLASLPLDIGGDEAAVLFASAEPDTEHGPGSQKLLRRSALLRGESLSSLRARLSIANGYEPPHILSALIVEHPDQEPVGRALAVGHQRAAPRAHDKVRSSAYDMVDQPVKESTYRRLAALTRIDPLTLYYATPHSFAPLLLAPGTEADTLDLGADAGPCARSLPLVSRRTNFKHLRSEQRAQYCPDCIREGAYHRLLWSHVLVSACTRHERLLVKACPKCKGNVSVYDIVVGVCRRCDSPLTQAESRTIQYDSFGLQAQRTLQAWLTEATTACGASGDPEGALQPPDLGLPKEPTSILYSLAFGLFSCAVSTPDTWGYLHSPASGDWPGHNDARTWPANPYAPGPKPKPEPPRLAGWYANLTIERNYVSFCTAFKGLVDWPRGFHGFVEAFRLRNGESTPTFGLFNREGLGSLYLAWMERYWAHPAFAFVQSAFDEYVRDNIVHMAAGLVRNVGRYQADAARSGADQFLSFCDAALLLGTGTEQLERIVADGNLPISHTITVGAQTYKYVRRDSILAIKQTWSKCVNMEKAYQILGISRARVRTLAEMGLIRAVRGPAADGSEH
jgi:hypothetical protein